MERIEFNVFIEHFDDLIWEQLPQAKLLDEEWVDAACNALRERLLGVIDKRPGYAAMGMGPVGSNDIELKQGKG